MSVVAGIVQGGVVSIGADRFVGGADWPAKVRSQPKVFLRGCPGGPAIYAFGMQGSPRFGDLIRYAWNPIAVPKHSGEGDRLAAFVSMQVLESIRRLAREDGRLWKDKEIEQIPAAFLLGVRGRLFEVHTDMQLGEYESGVAALGAGQQYALGALHAHRASEDPVARIMFALEAAEEYCGSVRRPFDLVQLTR